MEKIALEDLIGEYELSGIDYDTIDLEPKHGGSYQLIRFILNGKTYMAKEDVEDDYRSCLGNVEITDDKVQYNFPPQKVISKHVDDGYFDKLQFFDVMTNKIVLEIGTGNWDDYYPYSIMKWYPENLAINTTTD